MLHDKKESEDLEALRALYPELDDEELIRAQETLDRYLELALAIYERIRRPGGRKDAGPAPGEGSVPIPRDPGNREEERRPQPLVPPEP